MISLSRRCTLLTKRRHDLPQSLAVRCASNICDLVCSFYLSISVGLHQLIGEIVISYLMLFRTLH